MLLVGLLFTIHSVTRKFSAPPDTTLHALLSTALWVFLNSEFSIISVQPPIPEAPDPTQSAGERRVTEAGSVLAAVMEKYLKGWTSGN